MCDLVFEIQPTENTTMDSIHAFPAFAFRVASEGLPTVTVSGLPKSAEFEGPYADGLYCIDWNESGAFPDPGDYPVTITMKNAGGTTTASFTIRINGYPTYDTTELGMVNAYDLDVGIAFDDWNEAMGVGYLTAGSMSYDDWSQSWSWSVTGLPSGMSFNATTGKISGTPSVVTESKTYAVHFKKTYKGSDSYSGNYSYSTEAIIPFTVSPLPSWVVGKFTGYDMCVDYDPDELPNYVGEYFTHDNTTCTIASDGKLSISYSYVEGAWKNHRLVSIQEQEAKPESISNLPISYMSDSGNYVYEYIDDGVPSVAVVSPHSVWIDNEEVIYGRIEIYNLGREVEDDWESRGVCTQSLYGRDPAINGLFSYEGTKVIDLSDYGDIGTYPWSGAECAVPGTLTLKFGKNGAVTPSFTTSYNGKNVTRAVIAQPVSVENKVYIQSQTAKWYSSGDEMVNIELEIEVDNQGNLLNVRRLTDWLLVPLDRNAINY